VLHQNIITIDSNYKKRTQKDYCLSLKLQIVQEIEQGLLTPMQATNKYGIQAGSTIRTWLKNMVTLMINIQSNNVCLKH
jgi:hypothetical protein